MNIEIDIKTEAEARANADYPFDQIGHDATANAFVDGVNWFREAVWHSKDEIPRENGFIIIRCRYRCEAIHTDVILQLGKRRRAGWKNACSCYDKDLTWCYLADILPQKRKEVRL